MTKTARSIAAALGLGVAATLAFALPAHAAVNALPASDRLYAVECEDEIGQLLGIDSTTAAFTAIGSGSASNPDVNCAGPAAYDFTTNRAYWISWQDSSQSALMTVNLTTGVSTTIGQFTEAVSGDSIDASSIAINGSGQAFLIGRNVTDGSLGNLLFSLDLSSGQGTYIADLAVGSPIDQWWSFAFNATDSTFYAISAADSVDGGGIYTIDVSNGALTLIQDWDSLPFEAYGITFDSDGALWGFANDVDSDTWGLFSANVLDPIASYDYVGESTLAGDPYFSESIFMAPPPPALAATGSTGADLVPAAIALLLAGGVAVAFAARRRRA